MNEPLVDAIAAHLRRLREQQGLSLSRLAALSGIGKTTLSQLELGRGNPTIGTLEALADALGIDATEFFARVEDGPRIAVVRRGEGERVDGSGLRGNLVRSQGVTAATLEVHRLEIDPGAFETSASHGAGAYEQVCVARGAIAVTVEEETVALAAGDYASFPSDRIHVWRNEGEERAEIWVAVTLPRHSDPSRG